MKKKNIEITIITNLVLIVIVFGVIATSFFSEKIIPIYVNDNNAPIYKGDKNKKSVSLMFNVYENTEIVNSILEVLKAYDCRATFFVGGCWADDNGETLLKIIENGNEIGNHGYFHRDHNELDYEGNRQEILNTDKIVKGLCGVKPRLFAPPSGSFSPLTLDVANELEYKVIMWSKDTIDWRDNDRKKIYKRATENLSNGDLILMHPKEQTLLALSDILEYYRKAQFSVITVSENIGV